MYGVHYNPTSFLVRSSPPSILPRRASAFRSRTQRHGRCKSTTQIQQQPVLPSHLDGVRNSMTKPSPLPVYEHLQSLSSPPTPHTHEYGAPQADQQTKSRRLRRKRRRRRSHVHHHVNTHVRRRTKATWHPPRHASTPGSQGGSRPTKGTGGRVPRSRSPRSGSRRRRPRAPAASPPCSP